MRANKVELVSDTYLREIGMFSIFQHRVKDLKSLFNPSDLGEVYAIAMARTLGCFCLYPMISKKMARIICLQEL